MPCSDLAEPRLRAGPLGRARRDLSYASAEPKAGPWFASADAWPRGKTRARCVPRGVSHVDRSARTFDRSPWGPPFAPVRAPRCQPEEMTDDPCRPDCRRVTAAAAGWTSRRPSALQPAGEAAVAVGRRGWGSGRLGARRRRAGVRLHRAGRHLGARAVAAERARGVAGGARAALAALRRARLRRLRHPARQPRPGEPRRARCAGAVPARLGQLERGRPGGRRDTGRSAVEAARRRRSRSGLGGDAGVGGAPRQPRRHPHSRRAGAGAAHALHRRPGGGDRAGAAGGGATSPSASGSRASSSACSRCR